MCVLIDIMTTNNAENKNVNRKFTQMFGDKVLIFIEKYKMLSKTCNSN